MSSDLRFLRNTVFSRAPIDLRGLLNFFQRYLMRLDFLDNFKGCGNWFPICAKVDVGALRLEALEKTSLIKCQTNGLFE